MVFDWLNIGSPFFWCFVGSIFLGAAMSRVTRSHLGPERWTLVYLYLTVVVAATTAGVFVPGPSKFLDIRLAYFSAVFAAVGFACFRYAVVVGAPLVLITALALAIMGVTLRGWLPLQGPSQEIGRVRVYDAGAQRTDLRVSPTGESASGGVSGALPSGRVAPVVEALRFSSYYFFVASPVLYRLYGVSTTPSAGSTHYLPLAGAANGATPVASYLPGVLHKRIVGTATQPRTLQDYSVVFDDSLHARLIATSL